MDPKHPESYKPTNQAVNLLHELANLGHHISHFSVLANFATSQSDLDYYMDLIEKKAAEVQKRIQEFQQTGAKG